MELGQLYFFTATITHWRKLLKPDKYKFVILDSLANLVSRKRIAVYGFVVMPNHIHLIWELLEMNGKESPHSSFMKYTSHQIQKDLRLYHPAVLELFRVDLETRDYHFWQRDAMPILLHSPAVVYQKINYVTTTRFRRNGNWQTAQKNINFPQQITMKQELMNLVF